MEVCHAEILLVSRFRIITVAYEQDVFFYILLHDEPRTASESEPLALTDGVEPKSPVLTDAPSGLQFDDVAWLLAEVTAHIFVVVYLAQEADAL